MLSQADAIDQKNGWPAGTARAEILAGRGPDLVKSMEPTDLQRNYNWAHQKAQADNPNGTPAEIEIAAQGILLGAGAGGMGGPDAHDRLRALNQWKANPANANAPVPPYLQDDQKWKLYNTDLSDAKTQFNGINDSLARLRRETGRRLEQPEPRQSCGPSNPRHCCDHVAGKP